MKWSLKLQGEIHVGTEDGMEKTVKLSFPCTDASHKPPGGCSLLSITVSLLKLFIFNWHSANVPVYGAQCDSPMHVYNV